VKTGDTLPMQFSSGEVPLVVRWVYRQQNFIGIFGQSVPLLVSPDTLALARAGRPRTRSCWCAPEVVSARRRSARSSRSSRPTSQHLGADADEFRHDQQAQVDQFLSPC
jgi:hypothetical protein